MNKTYRVAGLLVATALALPGYSQQPQVAESLQVTLVEIPVTVIDRAGNPIRGLTPANFELIDEGQKRAIAYFEALDLASAAAQEPSAPMNPAARKSFLVLFDLSNSTPGNVVRAREAAKNFVKNQVGGRDLVSVATFSVENGFRLLTNFTTDRDLVRIAIDTLGNPKFFKHIDPLFLSAAMRDTEPTIDTGAPNSIGASTRVEIENELLEQVQDYNRMSTQGDMDFRRGRVRSQLKNFGAFAKALDSVSGRKQVVLLSEGFDARLVQGRETASQTEADAVLSGETWKVDSDARFGNTAATNEVSDMAELFRRSDVVLHAIDIKGLRPGIDEREGWRSSSNNQSLFLLANPTGGQVFKNANDLAANFQKMLKQQEVVYILGFQAPSTGKPGKFHNLKVKLVNVPGGSRASHRAGYYEPSDKISPIEETLSASAILINDIPQNEVPFHMMAVPFPAENANPRIPVIIEIPGLKLLEGARSDRLSGELFVYAFGRENAVKDFLHQRISLDLTKVRGALEKGGIKYYGSLSLPPGDYSVKTLIRVTETGRSGFHRIDLHVPQFTTAVVLPPLVFEEEGKWLMVKGRPRSVAEVDYPFEVANESFIPAAYPRFKEGTAYKMALFAYNVPGNALELDAKVKGAGGQEQKANVSLVGQTATLQNGATKLVLNFTPTGLAPGAYSLEVAVRDKNRGATQVTATKFVIE